MSQPLKSSPTAQTPVSIAAMAHDGRGIARVAGKAVFIEGALPGEEVTFSYRARHRDYDVATVDQVLKPSPQRVIPKCIHYSTCGGCS
ncbi:MAG: TRAM domain-containing protein, partial [Gammaproteobacteria bacterium]|nr:TRAM domain-containing protein [Gammaproteobacteria bacterium]